MNIRAALQYDPNTRFKITYTYNDMQRCCVDTLAEFLREMSQLSYKEMAYVIERASFRKFNN